MKKGKKQLIDWTKYVTRNFELPKNLRTVDSQCGAYVLHLLTGKNYKRIEKLGRNGHWGNKLMFSYLKKNGYKIIPITLGNVVRSRTDRTWGNRILDSHLVLLEQQCTENENTWSILHKGALFHSGGIQLVDSFEFINFPIAAAYVLYKEESKNE